MKIVNLQRVPKSKVRMEGANRAWKQVPVSAEDGSPTSAWRVFTMEPGGFTPYHQHPYEHVNYIIQGSGVLVDAEGNEKPLNTGDFVLVMPDEKHQYRNKSESEPFVMICGVPKEFEK